MDKKPLVQCDICHRTKTCPNDQFIEILMPDNTISAICLLHPDTKEFYDWVDFYATFQSVGSKTGIIKDGKRI